MRKKYVLLNIISLAVLIVMTACGSSSTENTAMYKTANYAPAEAAEYDIAADGLAMEESFDVEADVGKGASGAPNVGESGAVSSRKLITRMNIEAETEDLDSLVSTIEKKTESLGGYIENSSVYNSSPYYGSDSSGREADITARIPANRLNGFISLLEGSSNITSRSKNIEDVTLNYVDTQAHKEALEAERDSLLKLMDNAKSVEDIMAIETRLTDVRYQLESIERQLRSYDNQIDYSTVYINLRETRNFTPQESATVSERISKGFSESMENVAEGCVNFAIFFVTHIPQIIVFIIVAIIIILMIRAVILILIKKRDRVKKPKSKKKLLTSAVQMPEKNEAERSPSNASRYTSYRDVAIKEPEKTTEDNTSNERNNS